MVGSPIDGQILFGFELPPLRSRNDFIFDSAGFRLPNLMDPDKWQNRIVNNLLYYQTNYFLTAIIIFITSWFFYTKEISCGIFISGMLWLLYQYKGNSIYTFLKQNPGVGILIMLIKGYFLTYYLHTLLIFCASISIPYLVIFIHASLRLRNLKNKIVNKIEGVHLKRSPMGCLLKKLGVQIDRPVICRIKIPPLRSLNDFIFNSAGFRLSDLMDPDNDRIVNNLRYYEKNFYLTAIIIFYIIIFASNAFVEYIEGFYGIIVTGMLRLLYKYKGKSKHTFLKQNPCVGILIMLIKGYFLPYYLRILRIFFIIIFIVFVVIFIHASLRVRNSKNKIVNKIEEVHLKRSPMGYLLKKLGMESSLFE